MRVLRARLTEATVGIAPAAGYPNYLGDAAYPALVTRRSGGAAARDRVARLCAAGGDARTLRLELLAEIRRAVDFDAYAWLLTDPETSVGSAPLADVPSLPELPRLIRLKYLTPVNRWTGLPPRGVGTLVAATNGDRPAAWSGGSCCAPTASPTSPRSSSGTRTDAGASWICGASTVRLRVHRGGGRVPRRRRRRRSPRRSAGPRPRPSRRPAAERLPPGPVVLLLSPDLELAGADPRDRRVPARPSSRRTQAAAPVPAGAYNVAAQLLAVEAGSTTTRRSARVHLPGGRWLTLRAARTPTRPGPERDIAVTIEPASPAERLRLFSRVLRADPAGDRAAGHLAAGVDTREIARRMCLSAHTVQDHLKSIFAKTGTRADATSSPSVLGL